MSSISLSLFQQIFPLTDKEIQVYHFHHIKRVQDTRKTEKLGNLFRSRNALSQQDILDFSASVCRWGGRTGGRILWRIKKTNSEILLNSFSEAIKSLNQGNLKGALRNLQSVGGLGQFSYSSKHLRMLSPKTCAVLDSIVEKHLKKHSSKPERLNFRDYRLELFEEYSRFCQTKANQLSQSRILLSDHMATGIETREAVRASENPDHHAWTAADVDMAFFAWLQGWN